MTTSPTIENTKKAIEFNINEINSLLEKLKAYLQANANLASLFEMGHLYSLTLAELYEVIGEKKELTASDIESLSEELEEAQNVIDLMKKALSVMSNAKSQQPN